jgi:hypothetical protein
MLLTKSKVLCGFPWRVAWLAAKEAFPWTLRQQTTSAAKSSKLNAVRSGEIIGIRGTLRFAKPMGPNLSPSHGV